MGFPTIPRIPVVGTLDAGSAPGRSAVIRIAFPHGCYPFSLSLPLTELPSTHPDCPPPLTRPLLTQPSHPYSPTPLLTNPPPCSPPPCSPPCSPTLHPSAPTPHTLFTPPPCSHPHPVHIPPPCSHTPPCSVPHPAHQAACPHTLTRAISRAERAAISTCRSDPAPLRWGPG